MLDPYGVDPNILQHSTLTPRSEPGTGIGFGVPRSFPFKEGQPLGSDWSLTTGPWSVVPHDGFLRFQGHGKTGENAQATIVRPFTLNQTSVTIAFSLRVNQVSINSSGGFLFGFAPGLILDWGGIDGVTNPNSSYGYVNQDSSFVRLAPSAIKADGTWHRIVVNIQPGTVMLWEDDQLVFTWVPTPPLGDEVQAYFSIGTSGASASLDVGDCTVLVGTTQQLRLRMANSDTATFRGKLPYLQDLASLLPDVLTAAKPITDSLYSKPVGPGSLFWGLDFDSSIQQAARSLPNDQRVNRLVAAATRGANVTSASSPTFYIGISLSASFLLSGGYSLGFLIGTGRTAYNLAVLTLNGGGVLNAGLQGTVEVAVFWQEPSFFLGLGAYEQIDGGEFFQGSVGASGNVPLDLSNWSNCGPAINFGVGLSVSPVDIAAGLSYAWRMLRF